LNMSSDKPTGTELLNRGGTSRKATKSFEHAWLTNNAISVEHLDNGQVELTS